MLREAVPSFDTRHDAGGTRAAMDLDRLAPRRRVRRRREGGLVMSIHPVRSWRQRRDLPVRLLDRVVTWFIEDRHADYGVAVMRIASGRSCSAGCC